MYELCIFFEELSTFNVKNCIHYLENEYIFKKIMYVKCTILCTLFDKFVCLMYITVYVIRKIVHVEYK